MAMNYSRHLGLRYMIFSARPCCLSILSYVFLHELAAILSFLHFEQSIKGDIIRIIYFKDKGSYISAVESLPQKNGPYKRPFFQSP
jgi:hypothetical protein